MASSIDMAGIQQANPRRSKISITQKRWLLSAHLLFVTAWLGSGLCSLAFNITAPFTTDPHLLNTVSVFTGTLDTTVTRIGAGGTLVTGILLSVLTQWGLLRFYWIIAKEILAVFCVSIDLIALRWNDHLISLSGAQGLQALSNPVYLTNRTLLFVGIILRIIALSIIIAISIFRPWGQRKSARQRRA